MRCKAGANVAVPQAKTSSGCERLGMKPRRMIVLLFRWRKFLIALNQNIG
jgi:hypothetical protein